MHIDTQMSLLWLCRGLCGWYMNVHYFCVGEWLKVWTLRVCCVYASLCGLACMCVSLKACNDICVVDCLLSFLCIRLTTLKSPYWALVLCCFHSKQANLLYNGCRADWSSFIDVWVVDEWAGREEEEGFITSFNKSQGLWQSPGGLGGKSLDAQFNTTAFSPLRFSVWFCPCLSMWLAF